MPPQSTSSLNEAQARYVLIVKVNEYLDARALRQNKMFHRLLQAQIELAPRASEERSVLESISNDVVARGVAPQEELKL